MRFIKRCLLSLLVLTCLMTCLLISAQAAWQKDSRGWYYVTSGGNRLTNAWQKDSKGWCYLDGSGYMVTNEWVRDSKGWCYIGSDGYAVTNCWKQDSVGWCYLDGEGSMVYDQWVKDSVGWCYIGSEGYMVTNEWVRDSVGWCYVGADGYCVTDCWMRDSVGWVYLDSNGRMATDEWILDSVGWCYVGSDGYCLTNQWVQDSMGWCFLDSEGRMVKDDWIVSYNYDWSYVDADGYMVTGWYPVGAYVYYFDAYGIMATNQWINGLYVNEYGQAVPAEDKARDYLANWLIENGTVVGSYAEVRLQIDDVTYALGYAANDDYVYLVRDEVFEGTPTICMMGFLPEDICYESTYGGLRMVGSVDADNFTVDYPLTYTGYEGDPAAENAMAELTRLYLCELLDVLDAYLLESDAEITIASLGFYNYYLDREEQLTGH